MNSHSTIRDDIGRIINNKDNCGETALDYAVSKRWDADIVLQLQFFAGWYGGSSVEAEKVRSYLLQVQVI